MLAYSTTMDTHMIAEKLNEIISNPFEGPYEGEDYWIDEGGTIQVAENNVVLAAKILRLVNASGEFPDKLVKTGSKGDSIILGFDNLIDAPVVFTSKIGYKGDTLAEVKVDETGKHCVYLNKKRNARMFKKLGSVKVWLKRLDAELKSHAVEPEDTLDD